MPTTPCSDPANDPNDWFIERDGRQYHDEPVLSADEVRALWDECLETGEDGMVALVRANNERLKDNQRRRRKAKDLCHNECPLRTECLQLGLSSDFAVQSHGIWGGYYPEELRAIQREGRSRRRGMRSSE